MAAVVFDTLKLARTLREKAKLSPEQAEGFADALAEAFEDQVATKGDLRETEHRLDKKIEEIRGELAMVKAELALVKWIVSGVGFGVFLLVLKSFWPAP